MDRLTKENINEWRNAICDYDRWTDEGIAELDQLCDLALQALSLESVRSKALEIAEEKLAKILNWCKAYPLDIFPEPDFGKARELLKAGGMTLDAVSASNMRHVLRGIETIALSPARVAEGDALHASAPPGHKCADCTMDKEACPTCYAAWWKKRHPNTIQL